MQKEGKEKQTKREREKEYKRKQDLHTLFHPKKDKAT